MNEYEVLRQDIFVGFAQLYLSQCDRESKPNDEIDKALYTKLVELDTRLGTTASEQLYWCVFYTLNLDIIKVQSFL